MARLRVTTSWLCFVISVWFAALWIRSYPYHESMNAPHLQFLMTSWRGQITCHWSGYRSQSDSDWSWLAMPLEQYQKHWEEVQRFSKPVPYSTYLGFGMNSLRDHLTILFPHWFPTLLAGTAAVALKPAPRPRFNLQELSVATTVVAFVLGAIAYFAS